MHEILAITKALADESRLRALMSVRDGELCLCQIVDVLGLAPATVSRHMNVLYRAGLVERRRQGKWQFFRLANESDRRGHRTALKWLIESLDADPVVRADAERVRDARGRDLKELSACYRS